MSDVKSQITTEASDQRLRKLTEENLVKSQFEEIERTLSMDFLACLNQNRDTNSGMLVGTLLLFVAVELLGNVLGVKPEVFIAERLGRLNPAYRNYPTILCSLFRDQLAHFYQPGCLKIDVDGTPTCISWELTKNNDSRRQEHLAVKRMPNILHTYLLRCKKHWAICLHLEQFFEDLITTLRTEKKEILAARVKISETATRFNSILMRTVDIRRKKVPSVEIDCLKSQLIA